MDSADAEPLSKSERAELEKLRAEFAARQPSERRRGEHSGLRWVGVWILLVLILLLSFAGVLARYARSELLDSERYVQTVAPLGSNPVIQGEITNRITDEIDSQLDIESDSGRSRDAHRECGTGAASGGRPCAGHC